MTDWSSISWPGERVAEALDTLGGASGMKRPGTATGDPPRHTPLHQWIVSTVAEWGGEAVEVEASYAEAVAMLRAAGPALLRIELDGQTRYLALLAGGRRHATVLAPDLNRRRVLVDDIRRRLCGRLVERAQSDVGLILEQAGVPRRRREVAAERMLDRMLGSTRVGGCWLLRPGPTATTFSLLREARLPTWLLYLVLGHACEYGLWIASWSLLGWMTLHDRLEPVWLLAWLGTLLTLIPFRLLSSAAGGQLSIQAGAVIKRRLLTGALRMEPDEIRHLGVGQLMGRVYEAEAIELLSLTGGMLAITSVVELVMAAGVLAAGVGGPIHSALLLTTAAAALLGGWVCHRRRQAWTDRRIGMTNELVERMVGHRTRLAQQPRELWNQDEDSGLADYLHEAARLDRGSTLLQGVTPRGWFVIGLLGLAPAYVSGGYTLTTLAIGLGGVLLGYQALGSLAEGLDRISGAVLAWGRIKMFWDAATRPEPQGATGAVALLGSHQGENEFESTRPHDGPNELGGAAADVAESGNAIQEPREKRMEGNGEPMSSTEGASPDPLLLGQGLLYRYSSAADAVLQGVDLEVQRGDRILLQGTSGGGKSTLAAVLAGSRVPNSGLLLLDGADRATWGVANWRRRVVIAPQFHENHVLMGTLAFNLLMGRRWPAPDEDVRLAEEICRELDLGPLLDRMPAGMQQQVGETGWQLSHGEKSRLFLARALLQGADLVILDESFAALDPETLRRSLQFVLNRRGTLMVIAHP